MTSRIEVEAAAAVLARETMEWTAEFRAKMKWPDDLSKDEQAKFRGIATMVINAAKKARRENGQ